jgi:hypothetical protein
MFRTLTLLFTLALSGLLAEGIDGRWSGERTMTTPDGEERKMTTTLELKSSGGALTGKMIMGRRESEIESGKIDGNRISFTTKMMWPKREVTMEWEGVINGDEMTLERKGGGEAGRRQRGNRAPVAEPLTLKRVR